MATDGGPSDHGLDPLVEGSALLTIAQLAHHDMRHEPAGVWYGLEGRLSTLVAVPLSHLERLFMPPKPSFSTRTGFQHADPG